MSKKNEQREQMIEIGTCPICGRPIMWRPGATGQRPIYCSWACRQKAYRRRKKSEGE